MKDLTKANLSRSRMWRASLGKKWTQEFPAKHSQTRLDGYILSHFSLTFRVITASCVVAKPSRRQVGDTQSFVKLYHCHVLPYIYIYIFIYSWIPFKTLPTIAGYDQQMVNSCCLEILEPLRTNNLRIILEILLLNPIQSPI